MRNAALCLVPLMLLLCSCGSVPKTQEVTSSLADSDAVPADSAEAPQEAVPTHVSWALESVPGLCSHSQNPSTEATEPI